MTHISCPRCQQKLNKVSRKRKSCPPAVECCYAMVCPKCKIEWDTIFEVWMHAEPKPKPAEDLGWD